MVAPTVSTSWQIWCRATNALLQVLTACDTQMSNRPNPYSFNNYTRIDVATYNTLFGMMEPKIRGLSYFRQPVTANEKFAIRSEGTKVPQERKFSERLLMRNESSIQERKYQGANVPQNESSTGTKVPSVDFSLPGTKVQRNEKSDIQTI